MAEVTAMRNNALPYPVYGLPYTIVFPFFDADGDLVTGATTPDAEVSKNGDTFADCTNESTEIATASGVYYLTLTAAEMTADIVTVLAKSATSGMKTTVATLNPRKLPVIATGTCQGSNDTGDVQLAAGASAVDDTFNGCIIAVVIDSVPEVRLINDYVGSTKTAEINPAWVTAAPDNNDTYTIYLPEGRQVPEVNITFANGLAWAGDWIPLANMPGNFPVLDIDGDGVVKSDMVLSNGAPVETLLDSEIADIVQAETDPIATSIADLPTNAELATALGTADDAILTQVALVKAKTDLIPSDPADASDIAAAFSTVNGTLATMAAYTEVAAIKAKTDLIPAAPAAVSNIPTVSQIWTTALTESFRATSATGTGAQLLYEILKLLMSKSIVGTLMEIYDLSGDVAKTYTLNDADEPTAVEETS